MLGLAGFTFLTAFSQTSPTLPTEPAPATDYKSKEVLLTYKEQSYKSETTITIVTTGIIKTTNCIGEGTLKCTVGEEISWVERVEVMPIIPETDIVSISYQNVPSLSNS